MGNVQFYNDKVLFTPDDKVAMHGDCCCDLPVRCERCSGNTPEQLEVVLAGIVNDLCNDCAGLNGTFVLDRLDPDDSCIWTYYLPSEICNQISLSAQLLGDGVYTNTQLKIWMYFAGPVFLRDFGSTNPVDCEWSNLDVPYDNSGGGQCDASAATCTVTAL